MEKKLTFFTFPYKIEKQEGFNNIYMKVFSSTCNYRLSFFVVAGCSAMAVIGEKPSQKEIENFLIDVATTKF